jgi:hypothetical protein
MPTHAEQAQGGLSCLLAFPIQVLFAGISNSGNTWPDLSDTHADGVVRPGFAPSPSARPIGVAASAAIHAPWLLRCAASSARASPTICSVRSGGRMNADLTTRQAREHASRASWKALEFPLPARRAELMKLAPPV